MKKSHTYKAIGFDWSGVVFFHTSTYPKAIQHLFGIPPEEFRPIYYAYNTLLNVENQDQKEVWKIILSQFNLEDKVDTFLSYLESLPLGNIHLEMIHFIEDLKRQGYKVGLLSNHTLSGAQQARTYDLDKVFDVSFFSAEIKFMKPQPEAFLLLADKLGVDIRELIFIDDASRSLQGAHEVGYTPILYSNMEQLKSELSRLLQ